MCIRDRPWIVPIPGTTKRRRLEENLGADAISLSTADLREIDAALEMVDIEGDRYPPALQQLVGR